MKTYKIFLKESTIFDIGSVDKWTVPLSTKVNAPVIWAAKSVLGGEENVTIMLKISLDEKHNWKNGIFQNSRYAHIRIDRDGSMEMFAHKRSIGKAMRKTKVRNVKDAIKKINDWIYKAGGADYDDQISKRTTRAE